MESIFELDIDDDGRPVIKVKHHDKSNSLDQKVLGVFLNGALENGLEIKKTGGYVSTDREGHDNYEIRVLKKTKKAQG